MKSTYMEFMYLMAGGILVFMGVLASKGCGESPRPIEMTLPTDLFGAQVLEAVDPCGDNPQVADEKILKLSDGKFARVFFGARSLIPPGTYMTGDGDLCLFTFDNTFTFTEQCHPSEPYYTGMHCM